MTTQDNEIEIDIRKIIRLFLKNWYWFVLSLCILSALGTLYYFSVTTKYEVSTSMMIRLDDENGFGQFSQLDILSVIGMASPKQITDEMEILTSATVMQQAIKELNLQTEYRKKKGLCKVGQYPRTDMQVVYPTSFTDTVRSKVVIKVSVRETDYKIKMTYGKKITETYKVESLDEPVSTFLGDISFLPSDRVVKGDKFFITTTPVRSLAAEWREDMLVQQPKKNSNVVTISTKTDIPSRAIKLISKIIDIYNDDAVIDRQLIADNTQRFINERLDIITEELNEVEGELETYMKQNGITSLPDEATIYLRSASEYQKNRIGIETQQNILNFIRNFVEDKSNNNSFIPANLGVEDVALESLVSEYNELLLTKVRLERSATADNPMLTQLAEQLRVMHSNIINGIKSAESGLEIMRQNLAAQEKNFAGKIGELPGQEREFLSIKRQQEIKQAIYLFLRQKNEENVLSLANVRTTAKVIDKPQTSPDAVGPRTIFIVLIVLMLGMLIPASVLLLCDALYDKVRNMKELESLLKTPVLGQLLKNKQWTPVVMSEDATTASAELFRLLRTNLLLALSAEPNIEPNTEKKTILVTSSTDGEGKSFVALNTAISLAMLGKRVALVELNLRKPTLAAYLSLRSQGALSSYLAGSDYTLSDLTVSSVANNLDVLPAGHIPANPNELLQTERLDKLFAMLGEQYDYIIIDSAPVAMVSDTLLLNRFADATLYVLRADYTKISQTEFVNRLYEQNRLNNMMCVLNGVAADNIQYGYGKE